MKDFINQLERRASIQKYIAYASLLISLFTMAIGSYLFLYESPKIAAQDLEQHRKTGMRADSNSELIEHNLNLQRNEELLSNAVAKLKNIVRWEIAPYRFYDKDLSIKFTNGFAVDSLDLNVEVLPGRIDSLNSFLNQLVNYNNYLRSDEAKNKLIQKEKDEQNKIFDSLRDTKARLSRLNQEKEIILTLPRHKESESTLKRVNENIDHENKRISELEHQINLLEEQFKTGVIAARAENLIQVMLKSNEEAIEKFKIDYPILENRLKNVEKEYLEQKNLVNKLRLEQANLLDKKNLAMRPDSNVEEQKNDNKLAFYVSTNIARLGIMLVTIFAAQVFISIYRYLTRVSNFYYARADAIKLVTQNEIFGTSDLPGLIGTFTNILTPDKVDFGKMPQAPIIETIKSVHSNTGKS